MMMTKIIIGTIITLKRGEREREITLERKNYLSTTQLFTPPLTEAQPLPKQQTMLPNKSPQFIC